VNSDEANEVSTSKPPDVRGRHVALRAIRRPDYDYLYQLAVDPRSAFRWRLRGVTPDPRSFETSLWEQVLVQFAITQHDNDRPIGIVTCYAADLRSGVASIAILLEDQYTMGLLGGEALFLFIDYVLGLWNFRKLYAEMPEFNFASVASGTARWFSVEARLPERYWFRGRYWANVILAVDRNHWADIAKRFGPVVRGSTLSQRES
jgi:RimJ/RimL family protein N-acetyltransferase